MSEFVALIPVYRRLENLERLCDSFFNSNPPGQMVLITDDGDDPRDVEEALGEFKDLVRIFGSGDKETWAQKIQIGYLNTAEPFMFYGADDITFAADWWRDPLRMLHAGYVVVGTNDMHNPRVIVGQHATHFFVSRAYVTEEGATVDGPGWAAPTVYRHCYADDEIIQLATARHRWGPCLTSMVPHHHWLWGEAPNDPVYMIGDSAMKADHETYLTRIPKIRELA